MRANHFARPPRSAPLVALVALFAGCGSSAPVERPAPVVSATLTVVNPTGDSYIVSVDGAPRGTVAAHGELSVRGLPPRRADAVAESAQTRLTQRDVVDLTAGHARWTLAQQTARLEVVNPHAQDVELLIDGVAAARVAGSGRLEVDAPAGARTLIARATSGPGTARAELFLSPGRPNVWVLPELAGARERHGVPSPPPGMGLVYLRNHAPHEITVWVGGDEYARVPSGGAHSLIVAPGTHAIVVRIGGVDAQSEHTVTLVANQVAEWNYGEDQEVDGDRSR